MRDLGLTERQFGTLFIVNPVLIIFLEVPLNAATAAWPVRRTLVLGSLLIAVGFGAIGLAVGRGEYMGVFTMAFGLAHAVAPAAGTMTLERFGAPILWTAVFAVGLLASLLFARVSVR